ncbi:reverse transcriptase domain-containing protein [Tanacetum coccineum]
MCQISSFRTLGSCARYHQLIIMLRIASVVNWGDVRLLEAYERGVGVGLGFDFGSWAWTMDLDKWVKGKNQEEAVMLRTFPFSLSDEATTWLNELNEETITSWNELREAFISRYFSPAKFKRLLN